MFNAVGIRIYDFYRYNVRYGRVGASEEELQEAAKAADIHEKILTFPEGNYSNNNINTKIVTFIECNCKNNNIEIGN